MASSSRLTVALVHFVECDSPPILSAEVHFVRRDWGLSKVVKYLSFSADELRLGRREGRPTRNKNEK